MLIALPVLWATHGRLPPSTLLYVLIFVHAVVLMGHDRQLARLESP